MRTRQCAHPTCPFMVTDESAMWGWVHLDTHGADTSDHVAAPWDEQCPTCLGSGMISYGPWGARPPKKRCPDCRGGVTFKPKPDDLMLALHARLVQISIDRETYRREVLNEWPAPEPDDVEHDVDIHRAQHGGA